jgi:hypothetical protein
MLATVNTRKAIPLKTQKTRQPRLAESKPRLTKNKNGFWQIVSAELCSDGLWRTRTISCRTRDLAAAKEYANFLFRPRISPPSFRNTGRRLEVLIAQD